MWCTLVHADDTELIQDHYSVIICGAGPVGLLIALCLGQAGVKTLVLERHHELLPTTRAMVYQPVVLNVLRGLGILDIVKQHAFLNHEGIYWRDIHGKELGHLPMPEDEYVLLIGQSRMNNLILQEISKHSSVTVRFNQQYVGCEQNDGQVKVMVHEGSVDKDDDIIHTADWVIGTDGANSVVRRSLCIPFEGSSFFDFRMIGADVYYDFGKEHYGTVMNFVVHPEDWAVVIYSGQDKDGKPYGSAPPLWRVAYAEPLHLSDTKEDILQRAQERVGRYAKGKSSFDIPRAEPYRLHQRCAAQAIKGRVLLAGDALHSNNPIGGLGLTTGILDAYAIGNALARVCTGKATESLVAEAANYRREKWLKSTNKFSQMNLQRLRSEKPEDIEERDHFFQSLEKDADFPRKARAMIDEMVGLSFKEPQDGEKAARL